MAYQFIKYEQEGQIACITIHRPEALNALNDAVISELMDCFTKLEDDLSVDLAIITGEGRSFVAGADISVMAKAEGIAGRAWTKRGMDLMDRIENLRIPVIAAVNGYALGGGLELSMACDFRIASSKAKFGQPETGLGIIPGFGGTQRLPKLVGKGMASYLIFTNEMIGASEAYRIGLVEKVVEPEDLMPAVWEIAKKIVSKAPIATKLAKCATRMAVNVDIRSGIAYELEAFDTTFHTQDRVEGMHAFVEKRKPKFKNQ